MGERDLGVVVCCIAGCIDLEVGRIVLVEADCTVLVAVRTGLVEADCTVGCTGLEVVRIDVG